MNCKQLGNHFDIHGGGSDLRMYRTTKTKSRSPPVPMMVSMLTTGCTPEW
ncbi:hypothetical protein ACLB1Q_12725 [Escherichia coli]